jgi:hypothetical protein
MSPEMLKETISIYKNNYKGEKNHIHGSSVNQSSNYGNQYGDSSKK